MLAALAAAVAFRRLQEISHFAVHGVLARANRLNTLLAEVAVHIGARCRDCRERQPPAVTTF
ncbi:hypothetical protein WBG99_17025 [Streptomyces sp. TG1A-60]|uniref:hypothetical protein n=1 Tax=Streptomyces sp. TG1A-60 TaxID=3129111 RepID=UPI0030D36092